MDKKKIQVRFQSLLAKKNMTPHAFALEHNLNVSTITAIAGGKQVPTLPTLCLICECLGVGPETLLSDEEIYLLDEDEKRFVREYACLDSK